MALDDRTVGKSSQPFLYAFARASGNRVLACFDTFHIDAHITVDAETVFTASASNMGSVRTGNERLGRDASRIHTGAAKLVVFDNGERHARTRKPCSKRRACLTRPDDDCIEVPRHNAA